MKVMGTRQFLRGGRCSLTKNGDRYTSDFKRTHERHTIRVTRPCQHDKTDICFDGPAVGRLTQEHPRPPARVHSANKKLTRPLSVLSEALIT